MTLDIHREALSLLLSLSRSTVQDGAPTRSALRTRSAFLLSRNRQPNILALYPVVKWFVARVQRYDGNHFGLYPGTLE